ncbi:MAG: peptidoglycan DD-metalloendopeptidase family protein [Chloroflexia bacterium]|nr:peptidoglycan DD-metalloendopeptidase family protein [Chloroflexia bacterium]
MILAAMVVAGAAALPLAPTRVERVAAQSGSAIIAHSDDGVLLRAAPDYGGEVIGTVAEGEMVGLRTDETDTVYDADGTTRWWPVSTDVGDGWIAGFFLQVVGSGEAPAEAAADQAQPAAAESAAAESAPAADDSGNLGGSVARVAEADGVNLRAEPGVGGESVGALSFDTLVELRINEADTVWVEGGRWWPVRKDGQDGWVLGSYLAPAEGAAAVESAEQAAPAEAAAPANSGLAYSIGSYVQAITDDGTGLNIRADGAPDAERVGLVPENDIVQVMDGPFLDPTGRGWYLITDGDVSGYVIDTYLSSADQPPSPNADAPELERPERPQLPEFGTATGSFVYPVGGFTFTQGFGCSPYWFEPWNSSIGCNYHNGIDLANSWGTPLTASDGGVVEYSGWCDCGLGYYVKIDHGNGFKTVYGHMGELWVSSGDALRQGDALGLMGSTGNSTGPHVHFMVEVDGVTVDPLGYLP